MLNTMIEQLTTITAAEGALGVVAAAMLVQCALLWSSLTQAEAKARVVEFPGLMTSLARIPARDKSDR